MTDRLFNALRMHSGAMDSLLGQPRWGVVTSFDPVRWHAKVQYQPNDGPGDTPVSSGWLPVVSFMVGPGWGAVAPLQAGQQVLVVPDGGDHENNVVVGATWSASSAVPKPGDGPMKAGEVAFQSVGGGYVRLYSDGRITASNKTGAIIDLANDGKISMHDASGTSMQFSNNGSIAVQGVLAVTGSIKVNGITVVVP